MQEAEKFLQRIKRDLKADLSARLKELASRVELEFRNAENFIEVVTDVEESENLLPLETGDSIFYGNQPPLEEGEPQTISSAPFFLCVPYAEFYSYLNKDYRGAGFTYQLKPNYRFVAAERKLNRIARLYDVPLQIYSPYARRAVDICLFGAAQDFNLRLAENNLSGKLLANKKFYWNVEIDSVRWDSLNDDGKFYEYRCSADDSSFVLPSSDNFTARRKDGQIIFQTAQEFSDGKPERIKILPVKNKIASRILSKKRLRTQGDIEFVLSGLARDDYSCKFGGYGGAENICRYSAEHEYLSTADEDLLRAKSRLPRCVIKFAGEKIFLDDYANFVLKFLTENYPEFSWAGERDE